MNILRGGPWEFRWGKKAILKPLSRNLPGASMIPGRLLVRVPILGPLVVWIAGIAIHDLQEPDSRIRAFARGLLEKRKGLQHVSAIVVKPTAIEGLEGNHERADGEIKKS